MVQSSRFQPVLDRARQAVYAAGFVVAIGSLWTIAWANSLDDHSKVGMTDPPAAAQEADDPATPINMVIPAPDGQH